MSDHTHHHDIRRDERTPVDELWLRDWAAEGLAALEAYLAKHAAPRA